MNRHQVAHAVKAERDLTAVYAGNGARQAAQDTADDIARRLAELLPPAHRDQFLLAAGVPVKSPSTDQFYAE